MIVISFIFFSIVFTIFSFVFCYRTLKVIKTTHERPFLISWFLLSFVMVLLLIGLFFYLILIIQAETYNITRHVLVSALILILNLFILIILNLSFELVKKLNKINQNLIKKEKQLEKNKILLEEKNIKLNETLEDFYTCRLKMAGQVDSSEKKEIEKENKKLAKKIKKIR